VRMDISIGTGVLFNQGGVFVELYCHWVYWCAFLGGGFPLWKNGWFWGGLKVGNPPGAPLCIAFISCHDFVMLMALSFKAW